MSEVEPLAGKYGSLKAPPSDLAAQQHAVFSLAQLVALGITASAVRKRTATGRLYRVHRGVYSLVPPRLLTRRGRYMAAVLACGPGAVLSHRSAAALHELRATDRSRIDVTVPGSSRRRKVEGVEIHHSRTLTAADITTVDGIPCTTIARTLLDLAGVVGQRAAERAVEQAEVLELLNGAELDDQLERNRHSHAARRLGAVLSERDAGAAPTESELEERFLAVCRAAGIPPPERQVYITPGDGDPAIRVDFAWRARRLVVETDGGRYHRIHRAFESDRRKDQRLILAGWRVVRVTWRQLRDHPDQVVRVVVSLLASL